MRDYQAEGFRGVWLWNARMQHDCLYDAGNIRRREQHENPENGGFIPQRANSAALWCGDNFVVVALC